MLSARVIRPAPIVLAKTIGSARKAAGDLTSHLPAPVLTGQLRAYLERMLLVDASLGTTRPEWLNSPARDASAAAVKTSIEKLTWFRSIDAHLLDLSMLPNERRRFLATVAGPSAAWGPQVPDPAGVHRPGRHRPAGRGRGVVRPGSVGPGEQSQVQDR